ncbi:MAG: aminoglycoside phosphotransferase family protein [Ilumatobacteraceae bacterium]
MSPENLTGEWLSTLFGATVEVVGQSRIGDGLVGMNVRVALRSDDSNVPASVVVKLPSPDDTSRATAVALRNYEREVKFYQEIAPTVDIHVPVCHHAEWHEADHDFVLVLEDLAPQVQGNQITGCSIDIARTSVLELARLHGPRWDDPTLFDNDWIQRRSDDEGGAMLGAMWGMLFPGFIATYGKRLSTEATDVVTRFGAQLPAWIAGGAGSPLTVTHGDYRLDNLMFASPDGGAPITAVDWQTPGHGPGLADVAYFLGAGPSPGDRRNIERGLVGDYAAALRNDYGVEIDDDWAWDQYRYNAYAGVIMSVIASQIVGGTERSEDMFAAMATRSLQHVIDLESESLVS